MKTCVKLLFAVILLPFFSFAQSNYQPGYVVTVSGDTVRGFIDYRGWDSNPVTISFEKSADSKEHQSFNLNDINFFDVDGIAAYKKFNVRVSMDETNTGRLSSARDTSFKIETVFLRILQKGKNVALYSYTDDLKTRFYIGEAPDYTPAELVYRIYYYNGDSDNKPADAVVEGGTAIENTYQKQLFALANKYNMLNDDLLNIFKNANYTEPDLLKIVSRINGISKSEFKKKYAEASKFNLIVGALLNISTTSSGAGSSYTAGGGKSYTSYAPGFSVGVNLIPNPKSGKIEFRADLLVAETQFNVAYQLKVSPYTGEKASFDQLGISFVPQVIYNFYNSKNLKFYFGVGVDFTHFSYSNTFFGSQNPNVSDNGIAANDPYFFNTSDNSFLVKAGVRFSRKWNIFFNYLTNTATTQGGYFEFSNSSKQLGIAYLIGK